MYSKRVKIVTYAFSLINLHGGFILYVLYIFVSASIASKYTSNMYTLVYYFHIIMLYYILFIFYIRDK